MEVKEIELQNRAYAFLTVIVFIYVSSMHTCSNRQEPSISIAFIILFYSSIKTQGYNLPAFLTIQLLKQQSSTISGHFAKNTGFVRTKQCRVVWRKKEPFLSPPRVTWSQSRESHISSFRFSLLKVSHHGTWAQVQKSLSWADTQLFSRPSSSLLNSPEAGRY